MNPDWQWVFWSDEDNRELIKDAYPWFLPYYDSYEHPIQRADAVRYFYMHHYGGIYLDLDMIPLKPIEELLLKVHNCEVQSLVHSSRPQVVLFEEYPNNFSVGSSLYNAIMVSEKESSFWLHTHYMLENRFRKQGDSPKSDFIFETTGPRLLKASFMGYLNSCSVQNVIVLPYFYSNPCALPDREDNSKRIIFDKMLTRPSFMRSEPVVPWHSLPQDFKKLNLPNSYFIHDSHGTWR